jgi:FtsH-binding integral membrane protein
MAFSHHTGIPAARAPTDERAAFLVRTYAHLAGAVFAFVALEAVYFATGIAQAFSSFILGLGGFAWLIVLAAFIGVSWVADRWARSDTSQQTQYAGLGLYVVAESVIFMPLLTVAAYAGSPSVIPTAAVTTLVLFGGLTGVVFLTRKDFSFLRGILGIGGIAAMALIVVSILFGLDIGTFIAWFVLALAAGYVLYTTSNALHHYRTDQHVAVALSLFASIALMFYYVLVLLMGSRD